MLDDPSYYETLKDRVEIEFAPTQPRHYPSGAKVEITVDVKNVKVLIVKVFEVDTFNFYRKTGREVSMSINVDGLIANHQVWNDLGVDAGDDR